MRSLITGGAGFIGSHLADRLVSEGGAVTVVDNFATGTTDRLTGSAAGTEVVRHDITAGGLDKIVVDAAPEVVFHLAAQISVRASVADPLHDGATNVLGTLAVLEAARQAGARKVVFVSSVAIFGPPRTLPVSEAEAGAPLSPYAVSKLSGELYARQYRELHGLDCTTLVLTNTYGPRQDPHGEAGVVAIFADALLSGQPTWVFGDGGNTRDYLYVADAVDALVRAGGAAGGGQRFTIGTGVETSDLDLHARVAAEVGVDREPQFAPARPGDLRAMAVDARAARRILGWAPRTALTEGLAKTVAWLRTTRR